MKFKTFATIFKFYIKSAKCKNTTVKRDPYFFKD